MTKNEFINLEDVLNLMLDAVCVVDKQGTFVFVSAAFEQIFGYKADEVVGEKMINYVYESDHHKTYNAVDSLLSGEVINPRFENRWLRKDGEVVNILWSVRWSEEHQVRVAVAHDITERKKMEEQLYYIARHDALTELPNRSLLMERLQKAIIKAQKENSFFSLLFIDIDGFKAVNDTYGHDVGDKLLHSIALRLNSVTRECDTVGRLGGDEFLIILDNLNSPSEANIIKRKILAQFKMVFKFDDVYLNISPSIGIANYPDNGETDHQLIKHADQAMYKIKKSGENKATYSTN
ncbi:GGDEF domain-containing protein [Pseudoalteromonas sp. SWXJZ94C]|uniref:sensor domain-containing diguanylate cyclase n=1 Tax=unclassified Pseudoalteromonas TaxID=194690 RepID=UPI00140B3D6F|nr:MULTISPECIES: sensor domain-containing diguanylate cyclase [unclassified Pseudoalteromonas]MBH0059256.1 GGDEF domain-containing protein [Pseudoalteromonas sp. SWXJZ94C]